MALAFMLTAGHEPANSILLLITLASATELAQHFVTGRAPPLEDWYQYMLGIGASSFLRAGIGRVARIPAVCRATIVRKDLE